MTFSHLDLFYESRSSVGVTNSDVRLNPNTELNNIPNEAEIDFGVQTRQVTKDQFEKRAVRRFLIKRAMLDSDATVFPQ